MNTSSHLSPETLTQLIGLSVLLGALVGWFASRPVLLIAFGLALSIAVPYGLFYGPSFIQSLYSVVDNSPAAFWGAWSPVIIRAMFFYCSPAIWLAVAVSHFIRGRYVGQQTIAA